ncbi:hypothetical protein CP500_019950 [Tychonema bourrellyi FEM_GT703]|uniref:Uncharacterized protein n=1 Tax=Tychonema bourrellyi FEM_GT703 TaxID=2040638 RepID=A0A2G4EVY6_9CYAN|nr:hypothetical protein [Tychonema bourrellyi]PHX53712.1 hypothetical protein CP500_019950 [Tychonema bourrellyi FEM_GT703]
MPTPQENLIFVEQASCLFWRMVQDVIFNQLCIMHLIEIDSCQKWYRFIYSFLLKVCCCSI